MNKASQVPTLKVSVRFPVELHKEARIEALRRGVKFQDFLRQATERMLKEAA